VCLYSILLCMGPTSVNHNQVNGYNLSPPWLRAAGQYPCLNSNSSRTANHPLLAASHAGEEDASHGHPGL
jgi:hypothetical protein